MLYFEAIAVIVLLFASAFFSGAETALLKLSQIKIKHWIYAGKPNAQEWLKWLNAPHEIITAILVGNTLVNVFISSITAMAFAELFKRNSQTWIEPLAGAFAFVSILIFGEIVPKIYCRHNPERVATISLVPVSALSKILGMPFSKIFSGLGKILPFFREPPMGMASSLTLDEIRAIVLDPKSLSGMELEHKEMMRKVLELHQRTIEDVLVPWCRVDYLNMEEALAGGDALERFMDRWIECGRTRIPVLENEIARPKKVLGYLYVKDLLNFVSGGGKKLEAATILKWLHPMLFLESKQKVLDVIEQFRFGSPIACVRDPYQRILGIVTLEDILEEFVGEILDEYDREQ